MTEPRMSVVVPTFGRADSVARLLAALHGQRPDPVEIVLVDQNPEGYIARSIDPSLLEGVRHVRLEQPNASTARNAGFVHSTSPLVLFLDDDVVPDPDFCERIRGSLMAHDDVACLAPLVVAEAGVEAARSNARRLRAGPPRDGLWPLRETITAAVLFRREAFRHGGGFDEALFAYARTSEDQELFRRLRRRGVQLWLDPTIPLFHDEGVPGGCELRTEEYWRLRERFLKAWAYMLRMHAGRDGRLRLRDALLLLYSSSLNRSQLAKGPRHLRRQLALFKRIVADSRRYVMENAPRPRDILGVDHLAPHLARGSVPRTTAGHA